MDLAPFSHLADDARLWTFVLSKALEGAALARFEAGLAESLGTWRHKGQAYHAAFGLVGGQVLVVAEPTMATQPSGCAIEGLHRKVLRQAEVEGAHFQDEDRVILATDAGYRAILRSELDQAVAEGRLTAQTPVLDRTLFCLGDLRSRALFPPAHRTWLGRKYGFSQGA